MPCRERRPKFGLGLITAALGILFSFSGCAEKALGPERRVESGVEVVINGGTPYPVNGKLATLTIKEEFRIDLEDPKYAEMGLSDAAKAGLDSQGRVIIFRQYQGDGPLVFVFDRHGKIEKSFGRKGQGPGEITYPSPVGVSDRDEIVISSNVSIHYFDEGGTPLRSIPNSDGISYSARSGFALLANGSYIIQYRRPLDGGRALDYFTGVFDGRLRKIKDLVSFRIPDINEVSNPFVFVPIFCRSREEIFLGSTEGAGDVSVFDLNGNPKRIIRKAYRPVPIPGSFRDEFLKRMPENFPLRKNLKLPDRFPPFQSLFADDEGRLYVATYEKDAATGQNICEVFSPDGTSIHRAAIGYFDFLKWMFEGQPGEVVIRNGRLLCVRDKENGYREVVISSLIWN